MKKYLWVFIIVFIGIIYFQNIALPRRVQQATWVPNRIDCENAIAPGSLIFNQHSITRTDNVGNVKESMPVYFRYRKRFFTSPYVDKTYVLVGRDGTFELSYPHKYQLDAIWLEQVSEESDTCLPNLYQTI